MSKKEVTIYKPISLKIEVESGQSTMLRFYQGDDLAYADFHLPQGAKNILRFGFDHSHFSIFRTLDEFPLSTEAENVEGLIPNNLLYRVTNHPFLLQQSELWRMSDPEMLHYQFVTGGTCLDAITVNPPDWAVVPTGTPIPIDDD